MIVTKKEILWIILIVIIAFLVRIIFFSLHNVVELDGAYYISLGVNLFENGIYRDIENNLNTNLTPGMPIAIGLMNLIVNGPILSARLISAIFGALLIIPVYLFTKRMFSRKEALIAGILTAFYTVLVYASTLTYSDSFYLFLFMLGIYFGWLGLNKDKIWMYLVTGLIFGIASLVRPESVLLPFIIILFGLIVLKKIQIKNILRFVLMLFIFFIVLSPWLIFEKEHSGKWQLSTKGGFTYLHREFKIFTNEYEKNQFSLITDKSRIRLNPYNSTIDTGTVAYILEDPGKFISRYIINFRDSILIWLTVIFPIVFFILAFYGFLDTKDRIADAYLLLIIFYPFFIYAVYGSEGRWLLHTIPVLLIYTSKGLTKLEKWNKTFNVKIITFILSVLMLTAVLFVNSFAPASYEKSNQPVEHKTAGEWLKNNIGEGRVIMGRRPWVSFYSNGRYAYLPYADYADTMEYACKNNVEYFVADSRYLENLRPQLKFMLDDDFTDLNKIYENNINGNVIKIFKVECR